MSLRIPLGRLLSTCAGAGKAGCSGQCTASRIARCWTHEQVGTRALGEREKAYEDIYARHVEVDLLKKLRQQLDDLEMTVKKSKEVLSERAQDIKEGVNARSQPVERPESH